MHTSRPVIPDDAQLEWLIEGNPKLIGIRARERFEKSFGALTVAEYKARGGRGGDLRADIDLGFVRVRFYRRRRPNDSG
jgi:hypothetical protein